MSDSNNNNNDANKGEDYPLLSNNGSGMSAVQEAGGGGGNGNAAAGGAETPTGGSESPSFMQRQAARRAHRREQSHHRRESSLADFVMDAIHEGVVYVEEVAHTAAETIEVVVENVADGVQNITETVTENVHEFRDNVVEEAELVVEAVVEEMTNNDHGDNFLLEMSLARNLSILPEDVVRLSEVPQDVAILATDEIVAAAEEAAAEEAAAITADTGAAVEGPPVTERTPLKRAGSLRDATSALRVEPEPATSSTGIFAYLLLASAVISLSSIGPLLDMQEGCIPTMKIFWRMSATAMMLFPFAAHQVAHEGIPKLTCPQMATMCLSAACYATMCTSFVLALPYTSVGNAVILSNSQAIMLLVAKFLVGAPVTWMEGSGAFTAFAGAILCSKDSADQQGDDATTAGVHVSPYLTLLGDFFGLLAGMAGCGYLVFAKIARSHLGLYTFMFLNMFIGCTFVCIFMVLVLGQHVTFDRDENIGLFGWMNLTFDRLPLELMMVVICNMFGALGYVRSMQYFDNLVISVAALMEPVVAELLALALGVGSLPGVIGWLGNALVAIGTFCVIAPSSMSGKGGSHGH